MITSWINGLVHFGSLVFFGVLFFLLLERRRENDLVRDYLRGDLSKRVQVDWPLRFLSRFCSALDISFEGRGSLNSGSPKSLRKEVLFETLLLYGIDAIQYQVEGKQDIHLTIRTARPVANIESMQEKLASALMVRVSVISQTTE